MKLLRKSNGHSEQSISRIVQHGITISQWRYDAAISLTRRFNDVQAFSSSAFTVMT